MLKIALFKNVNRKGSAIVFVIMIFMIVGIISTSVFFLFSSNLQMAAQQEENMRGHYLALAGIDITKATLLSTLTVVSGVEKTLFNKIREDKIDLLGDQITIDGEEVNITVEYDEVEDIVTINSSVALASGSIKDLSLKLEFSGNQYKERWIR